MARAVYGRSSEVESRITSFGLTARWIGVNSVFVQNWLRPLEEYSTADSPSFSMGCRTVVIGGL